MPVPKKREKRGDTPKRESAYDDEFALLRRLDQTRRHDMPALVENPSKTTLDALEHVRPWTLYATLRLWSLGADNAHVQRTTAAKRELAEANSERRRWLRVERHLRDAVKLASAAPYGELATWTYRSSDWISAIEVLTWTADSARALAAGDRDPAWNKLETAKRDQGRSPKEIVDITRARARFLIEKLRPAGLGVPYLTDLVLASESDWTEAPIALSRECRSYRTLKSRLGNLLRSRR